MITHITTHFARIKPAAAPHCRAAHFLAETSFIAMEIRDMAGLAFYAGAALLVYSLVIFLVFREEIV